MRILSIESSCDETAIAILSGDKQSFVLEKSLINSQVDTHKQYGGVVPEVASRQHLQNIIPLLEDSLGKEKLKEIDYIAVTVGPGLISSLILGVTVAKSLAYAAQKPLIAINHIEGHIYSNWLSNKELLDNDYFPSLALVVSGGHTELILVKGHGDYELIGQTLDDAVGEAYDKVAKLLKLGYPGGPIVARLAEEGDVSAFDLPRPMINSKDFDFSLSGLKTAVLYALEKKKNIDQKDVVNMCASFQEAITEVLLHKTMKAAKKYKVKSIMICGGVSANTKLQKEFSIATKKLTLPFFYPSLKYTGDNAAMIAVAAYYNIASGKAKILEKEKLATLDVDPNWRLVKNKK